MAAKDSSEQSQPLLTPNVVNPPPSTPQPTERYRDDVTGNDESENFYRGDDDRSGTEFHFNFVVVIRVIIAMFTFSNIVVQLVSTPTVFASVMLVILSFFTLFWNIFASLPSKFYQLCFGRGKDRRLQVLEFGFFFGERAYYITGGGSDGSDRRKTSIGASIIDLVLAFLILLFAIDSITNPGWRRGPYARSNEPILGIHFTVMALEFLISVFQHIRGVRIIFNVQARNNYHYRIQLPQDPEARPSANKPVSIAA